MAMGWYTYTHKFVWCTSRKRRKNYSCRSTNLCAHLKELSEWLIAIVVAMNDLLCSDCWILRSMFVPTFTNRESSLFRAASLFQMPSNCVQKLPLRLRLYDAAQKLAFFLREELVSFMIEAIKAFNWTPLQNSQRNGSRYHPSIELEPSTHPCAHLLLSCKVRLQLFSAFAFLALPAAFFLDGMLVV